MSPPALRDLGVPEDRDGVLGAGGEVLPLLAKLHQEVLRALGPALLQGDERYGLVQKFATTPALRLGITWCSNLLPPLRCGQGLPCAGF